MIGLIVAIEEELNYLLKNTNIISESEHGKTFYNHVKFEETGLELIIVRAGAGKVNAAIAATVLIEKFEVNRIISTGVAGGVEDVSENQFVIASNTVNHDVDMTSYRHQYSYGQVRGLPLVLDTDELMKKRTEEYLADKKINYKIGTIASGDKFIRKRNDIYRICETIDEIVAVDMESASIAQVCFKYSIPFLSIRIISDVIDSLHDKKKYNANINEGFSKNSQHILRIISNMQNL